MNCEYVIEHYGVPAKIGRRVIVGGKPGVIAEDRGHYIGVNLDCDKPGVIVNAHPTSEVEYGEMGKVRKPSRHAARYQRYLEYGDCFDNFVDFCRWDADPERSWNSHRHNQGNCDASMPIIKAKFTLANGLAKLW